MNRYYIAVTEQHDNKHIAYVIKATSSDNLLSKLSNPHFIYANAYGTRKKAEEVVAHWNQSYRDNGTYLFAE